uniref:Uncharacterized protein LOC111111248 isoform X2 n=1 Tax=Crassostrea virginica TaxID=6565 RepID=A0A8B8BKI4_CRAVI|nr:uncharacterized protein LOC111111248 isoform X2 [Crassostrea virginica]XP_022303818.1 uncharacterized protein LOC111111248 isoform X3 [Crassostrea virginica]
MNPKLFLIAFWSLAYIVNGQTTPSPSPPPRGIPTPSKALIMEDLPSQDQIMMDMPNQNFPPPEGDMRNTPVNTQELPPRPVSEMIPRAADGTIQDPSDMRLPSPGFNVGPTDGPITVGNIQVVYNDELRAIMKDYDITPEEIRRMLELYARGGSATITKRRVNPSTGLQEVITLDFDKFTTQRQENEGGSISVAPTADTINGVPGTIPTVGPSETTLKDFQETERYLMEQIKELDAQLMALDTAFRMGQISKRTRDENAILNRDQRRKFESDLGAIQQEINRITGVPKARRNTPRLTAISGTTSQRFGMGQPMPERPLPQQPFGTTINTGLNPTQRPGLPGPTGSQVRDLSSFESLRRELRSIRARELYILNRLRQLSQLRNSQRLLNGRIPFGRNVPMLSQRRRISFGTPNVNQVPRTLRGSVTGQNVERRHMV